VLPRKIDQDVAGGCFALAISVAGDADLVP
jgi:hypothetical protein